MVKELDPIRSENGRYLKKAVENIESWGYKGLRDDEKPSLTVSPASYSPLYYNPEIGNADSGSAVRLKQQQQAMADMAQRRPVHDPRALQAARNDRERMNMLHALGGLLPPGWRF